MKKFGRYVLRMTPAERSKGRFMRAPDDHANVDITQDLTDGSDGALSDIAQPNAAMPGTEMVTPPGSEPKVGTDAKQVNQVDKPDTEKEVSLRESLSSAFKGTDNQPTDQANAQNVQAAPALTQDADGKYRNPDGTFASIEAIQAFTTAAPASTDAPVVESQVLGSMTPAEQTQFKSLPAELQQYVGRTMEGLNNRAAMYSEYDLLENQIIGPRRQALAANGTSMPMALNQLFSLSDFASRDPGGFILWMADNNKIDLDALLDARDATQANVTPEVAQLQATVNQLQNVLGTQQQQQQSQAHEARLSTVQNFALEKDEGGALKRPYLTEVNDDWARQIQVLKAQNPNMPDSDVLQKAYDNACWTNPNVRASMQKTADDARRAQQNNRVTNAQQAGKSISGAPSTDNTSTNDSNRTLRDELVAQFAAATA